MTAKKRRKKTVKSAKAAPVRKPTGKKPPSRKPSQASSWRKKIKWTFIIGLPLALIYMVYLDHQVTTLFEGRLWQLPARVYARPLEVYEGKSLDKPALLAELGLLNYTRVSQLPSRPGQYHQWDNVFEIRTRGFKFHDGEEQSASLRLTIEDNRVSLLEDLYSSNPLAIVRFDPAYLAGIFPAHGEDRLLLKLEEVPDNFIKMLILVEDRRFFEHAGVDPRSIARALVANIKAGGTVQGGSTITQQLVKNLFLSSSQNLWRKLNEAIMALLLELHYDKRMILETYINEVYLGQDQERAIHGFGLASDYYFGKPLQQTSMDEMSLLVGMVKGASYYHPGRNPARAAERRKVVLNTMAENGLLTQSQADALSLKPLQVTQHGKRGRYPAFIDLVRRQLNTHYDASDLRSEGLQIFTTLDPTVHNAVENAIETMLPAIDYQQQGLQAAAVVVAPGNGDVLALVGDRNPSFSGFNRALDAHRQIGSLIKPVIYLAALQHPEHYTLASMLDDSPLRVMGEDKKVWEPQNYDNIFHGDLLLFEALLKSYNVPTAKLGLEVGLTDIVRTLRDLGSERDLPPYPSITLGAVAMTPFEVASVYQTFAANGFHSPLRSVIAVLDSQGTALTRYALEVKREINPDAISLINYTLQQITRSGTASRLASDLDIAVAGKTGTSNDLRDSWFAGFSGDLVSVVWVGNDDNQPAGITGASGAMRVWSRLMREAAHRSFVPLFSENIEMHWIDRANGEVAQSQCENALQLPFIRGSEPLTSSSCDQRSSIDWLHGVF